MTHRQPPAAGPAAAAGPWRARWVLARRWVYAAAVALVAWGAMTAHQLLTGQFVLWEVLLIAAVAVVLGHWADPRRRRLRAAVRSAERPGSATGAEEAPCGRAT